MKKFAFTTDIWDLIERQNVQGWQQVEDGVEIPDSEYERITAESRNPKYIENLLKCNYCRVCSHGYIR